MQRLDSKGKAKWYRKDGVTTVISSIISILIGLAVGTLIIIAVGLSKDTISTNGIIDGNKSATLLNLLVVKVDAEKGYILIKGGLPGSKKSIVTIRSGIKTVKNKPSVKPLIERVKKVEAPKAPEAPVEEAATDIDIEAMMAAMDVIMQS